MDFRWFRFDCKFTWSRSLSILVFNIIFIIFNFFIYCNKKKFSCGSLYLGLKDTLGYAVGGICMGCGVIYMLSYCCVIYNFIFIIFFQNKF